MIRRALGLRTQILMMLLAVAILPLGLTGLWLTSSAVRGGEELLRDHLDASADLFVAGIASRWAFRRGDIALVVGNESAERAVTNGVLRNEDRDYLDRLGNGFARTIPMMELRDSRGNLRWSSTPDSRNRAAAPRGQSVPPAPVTIGPTVRVETPILSSRGARVGMAVTNVALTALTPPDSSRPLVPGGRAAIRARGAASALIPLEPRLPFPDSDIVRIDGRTWFAVRRAISSPALDIAIGAPLDPYVGHFKEAAEVSVGALLLVAAIATVLTIVLATRATRPLEELAAASEAIAQGALDAQVTVAGPSEVRHLGAAFNLMAEHLHATLDQLSHRSALAAVGEFATSLSHDVRNALTAIKVDLDRASRRHLDDRVAADLVQRALNNVARLESSVTGALQVARHGHAPAVDIDARHLVREAATTVAGTFAAIDATLTVTMPDDPCMVNGEPAALQQVFANLLFNAAQSLGFDGSSEVLVRCDGSEIEICISDTGVGISDSEMTQLGNRFYSSKATGTGLGLPIARQIVGAHGGTLVIESVAGSGTTVRVRLPRVNVSFMAIARDVHSQTPPVTDESAARRAGTIA